MAQSYDKLYPITETLLTSDCSPLLRIYGSPAIQKLMLWSNRYISWYADAPKNKRKTNIPTNEFLLDH